jgi:two-component system chemotaxis response regulator CheY
MIDVLVVDDSPVIRKVARRILDGMRFMTREADDGRTALQACAEAMPDAILLDWSMPMDGYDFLRELRKMPGGRKPRVVFCTTENDIAQIARAMHLGASDHMLKPFDREIVRAKFEEIGFA